MKAKLRPVSAESENQSKIPQEIENSLQQISSDPIASNFSSLSATPTHSTEEKKTFSSSNSPLARKSALVALENLQSKKPENFRILVVEDSEPNRKLLLIKLKRLGFIAEGAENGKLAVEIFEKTSNDEMPKFDLILMDGSMPIMGGPEATRAIRALGMKIPILAVTGNALQEDVKEFIDAGANEVLTKPVNEITLVAALNKYLNLNI